MITFILEVKPKGICQRPLRNRLPFCPAAPFPLSKQSAEGDGHRPCGVHTEHLRCSARTGAVTLDTVR